MTASAVQALSLSNFLRHHRHSHRRLMEPAARGRSDWGPRQTSQQQQHDQQQQQQQLLWPPLLPPQGAGATTSIGPGFMATRPTAAKTTLKCPKCESTNTKFCYYNNFSLNQPRYFCKTCRKYWTAWRSLTGSNTGGGDG